MMQLPSIKEKQPYGLRTNGDPHGFVLTKPEIAKMMLDLIGYTPDKDLGTKKILEPSCGYGVFLEEATKRLLASCKKYGRDIEACECPVIAFDIDKAAIQASRSTVMDVLQKVGGLTEKTADSLASNWITDADFLTSKIESESVDFIVGNPPYIRIEQIPKDKQKVYRDAFKTLYDRADLYVAFIEKSLQLLAPYGVMSFVCTDRWISNRYGKKLRNYITHGFNTRTYIDLHDVNPFETEVNAYPSIFVIQNSQQENPTSVYKITNMDNESIAGLVNDFKDQQEGGDSLIKIRIKEWFKGEESWILHFDKDIQSFFSKLSSGYTKLEDAGVRVGIGVATGKDSVYILPKSSDLDIEEDRLMPLIRREDISSNSIQEPEMVVVNTFDNDGVIDLQAYPKLKCYLERHRDLLEKRHVAKKNPEKWYRTIDRVHASLQLQTKLLIPDIAKKAEVFLDSGLYYPHHNLYYIVSETWDLSVLGGLLSSTPVTYMIRSHSVKMRGGYARFQAQNLRKVRVPLPNEISKKDTHALREAFLNGNQKQIDSIVCQIYGLSKKTLRKLKCSIGD